MIKSATITALLLFSASAQAFKPTCEYVKEFCAFSQAEGCKQAKMSNEQYQALKQFYTENCRAKNKLAAMAAVNLLLLD